MERKDNASCVQVLFSLYDLFRRSPDTTLTKAQLLVMSEDPALSEEDQSRLERSQVYLGYKLFWLIRLYLNGRKFPQGLIKENKWRAYAHDIVQFLSNPVKWGERAELDAAILLKVISVLFLRT